MKYQIVNPVDKVRYQIEAKDPNEALMIGLDKFYGLKPEKTPIAYSRGYGIVAIGSDYQPLKTTSGKEVEGIRIARQGHIGYEDESTAVETDWGKK